MQRHPGRNGQGPEGLIRRAVAEALGAVAAPVIAACVIDTALRASRRAEIPERGPEVAEFVHGPLFQAAEQVLGEDAAHSVLEELAPLMRFVADEEVSSVRPSRPVPRKAGAELPEPDRSQALWAELSEELDEDDDFLSKPTTRPRPLAVTSPAPGHELPLVLVASSDPSSVSRLSLALCGIARIEPVGDALTLLECLGRSASSLVVLDSRHPSMRAETLLAMDPELPAGSQVVIWGERAETRQRLSGIGTGVPERWTLCGPDASADDVAAVCRVLLS